MNNKPNKEYMDEIWRKVNVQEFERKTYEKAINKDKELRRQKLVYTLIYAAIFTLILILILIDKLDLFYLLILGTIGISMSYYIDNAME